MSITVRNLRFAYKKGRDIIFCPKLDLPSGEIYILQGPNGSGKTTFLKLILGLLKPSTARSTVLMDGRSHTFPIITDCTSIYLFLKT